MYVDVDVGFCGMKVMCVLVMYNLFGIVFDVGLLLLIVIVVL